MSRHSLRDDLRTSTTWRAHSDALREAGWERIDTGFYRHAETGLLYQPFVGVRVDDTPTEVWRVFARRGELPDPALTDAERRWKLQDDPRAGTRHVEASDHD